jgi:hypothetical protein
VKDESLIIGELPPAEYVMRIHATDARPLVTLKPDGTVIVHEPGADVEASRRFWETLEFHGKSLSAHLGVARKEISDLQVTVLCKRVIIEKLQARIARAQRILDEKCPDGYLAVSAALHGEIGRVNGVPETDGYDGIEVPTPGTVAAMEDAREGNMGKFGTAKELMADLHGGESCPNCDGKGYHPGPSCITCDGSGKVVG